MTPPDPTRLPAPRPVRVPPELADYGFIVMCGMPFGGDVPWGDTQLARALARYHPVLVVDRPIPTRRLRRLADTVPHLAPVGPRLTLLRYPGAPGSTRRGSARATDRAATIATNRAARSVLGPRRILVNFATGRGPLPGIGRDLSVYWRRDAFREPSQELLRRHARLIAESDLVTGVSAALVDGLDPERSAVVANGADVNHFSTPAPRPDELGHGRPVIGFTGAVSWRFDTELLSELAKRRPDWTFVVVGDVRDGVAPQNPNVTVLGQRPYAELPGFTQHFDVGLIPYVDNPFNRASDPLKALEYLASGTPVVSTLIPSLHELAPMVRFASEPAEMIEQIEGLLANPDPAGCRSLAAAHHWDNRVRQLHELAIAALHRQGSSSHPT